ncbi:ATG9 [Auxenochlorella protothecoides x Auxenochlorella symbiontica]|uniref:Autophagy-related protein 9 n=1 Tax=Auxenochlorella protothecoides TaxID=3075 RepID=A0A1D2A765_AUXPR
MDFPDDEDEPIGTTGGRLYARNDTHEQLLDSESFDWEVVPNLDHFFTRVYRYWEEKGFWVCTIAQVLNLLALDFTVVISGALLLGVNYSGLQEECLKKDSCDIWTVMIKKHPLEDGLTVWNLLSLLYLVICSVYCVLALAHLVMEVRGLAEIQHFFNQKLGISERRIKTITWPEVLHRLVQVQRTTRLCASRDLSEHDIVSRIMRRENYLIGMLNLGVLALNAPVMGARPRFLLTKTLEWNLYWCVLDAMFDDNFRIKAEFLHDRAALQKRFQVMAGLNLLMSPFLLAFLLMYFFMKKAEQFYHHPSSLGARYWSPLAKWKLREFNELPHFLNHRLNASNEAAEKYISQFPLPAISHVARFVAFVAGSFAALLLLLTLVDGRLLERDLLGRHVVWWLALLGIVLAASRAFIVESTTAFDPEAALTEVVTHTHYLPRHWRGRAHTLEVQEAFQGLFQFKAVLFFEEMASILLTPLLLYFSLPGCAGAILTFVEQNTVHVDGIGDVCSFSAFDLERHGNRRYGSPVEAPKAARSHQGKLEKSFLSFAAAYPTWEPPAPGQALVQAVGAAPAAGGWAAAGSRILPPLGASSGVLGGSTSRFRLHPMQPVGDVMDVGWGAEERMAVSQMQLHSFYKAARGAENSLHLEGAHDRHPLAPPAESQQIGPEHSSRPPAPESAIAERVSELLPMHKYGSL